MSSAAPPDIQIKTYRMGNDLMVVLEQRLRMSNCIPVKQMLDTLMTDDLENYYLYMNKLVEIDSSGLGILVGLHVTARKRGVPFKIVAPTEYQNQLFHTTRLSAVFTIIQAAEGRALSERFEKPENEIQLPPW